MLIPLIACVPLLLTGGVGDQVQLVAPESDLHDQLGCSVSLSGVTLVGGAPQTGAPAGPGSGGATVFVLRDGTWVFQAQLIGADTGSQDHFGKSVSVRGDTLAVGAHGDEDGRGAAYVFTRSGSSWTQQAKLVAPDAGPNDVFGTSISVSGDTLVVGATRADVAAVADVGAVYVFERAGTTWAFVTKLTGSDAGAQDRFGSAVDLQSGTLVVGAYRHGEPGDMHQGAAYVFERGAAGWVEQAKLMPDTLTQGAQFGLSVAVADATIIVGASEQGDQSQGAAFVYTRSGSTWTQQAELHTPASQFPPGSFGLAVDVCGDRAVVTDAFSLIRGSVPTGRAFVFERSGSTWTPVGELYSESDMIGSGFGWSAAISRQVVAAGEIFNGTIYVAPLTAAAPALSWVPSTLGWYSTNPANR